MKVKVKFCENNEYLLCLDGSNWVPAKGEVEYKDGRCTLRSNIDGAITSVNIFRNDESLALFDEVSVAMLVNF